ncbi:hypothetical protein [Streptomyces sp. NPDC056524]|uniref:hypothetical protein n=1 Tax=Streptomyces sp. NPDC056524 TaxID=3345851 RepID=UPI0036AC30D4
MTEADAAKAMHRSVSAGRRRQRGRRAAHAVRAGASQWLPTSPRIAGEGYSWMQAVRWVAGSGLYRPRRHRSHGPRSFGATTVRVAQEFAQLFPCRPGIEYLVRRTGLSERSVEYHLGMLREAGLLAWIVKGTRVSGGQPGTFRLPAEPCWTAGRRHAVRR